MQRVSHFFRLSPRASFRPLNLSTRSIVNFTLSNRPLLTHDPKFVFKTTSPLRRTFATQSPKHPSLPVNQSVAAPSPVATVPKNEGRLRSLMRKYGMSAVVIYLGVGTIDLSITFMALRQTGGERIRELEDWLSDKLGSWYERHAKTKEEEATAEPSYATILAIAYAIHKTFLLPVRLGITAAITPPIVKALQRRGWNIGVKKAQKVISNMA